MSAALVTRSEVRAGLAAEARLDLRGAGGERAHQALVREGVRHRGHRGRGAAPRGGEREIVRVAVGVEPDRAVLELEARAAPSRQQGRPGWR